MERYIKNGITAIVAMLFGTASGCVMDAHQKEISSEINSYQQVLVDNKLYPLTALSNFEVFDQNSVVVRELDIPDRFYNIRAVNRCTIDKGNPGCSGGCVTL